MPVTLRARDLIDKNIVVLDASDNVSTAINKMVSSNVWSLIVEKQGLPVGVVTERDVLRRCFGKGLAPSTVKLEEIMSSPIITVGPDASVGEMMEMMVEKSIRRVFVVENGKVIGRVTQTGLFQDTLNVMMSLSSLRYSM